MRSERRAAARDDVLRRLRERGVAAAGDLGRRNRYELRRMVRAGLIMRCGRGAYALAGSDPHLRAATALRGVRCHLSAARSYGWQVMREPGRPSVAVPPGRNVPRRRRVGVDLHRRRVSALERAERRTAPLQTVLDCARDLPFIEALAVADSAIRSGLVGEQELRRAAERLRGPRALAARRVAAAADAQAASALESGVRALLLTDPDLAHLAFHLQFSIVERPCRQGLSASGFAARVDLAEPQLRLIVEAEGYEFHGGPEAFERDCRRYNELVARDWVVLRFTWGQVRDDPQWVRDVVRRARDQQRSRVALAAGRAATAAA